MERTTRCSLAVVIVSIMVVAAPGFQHIAPSPAGTETPLQAQAEVVLNVVADDGHGRLVADLSRDDFQVFEDGKQQPISSFERREGGPQPLLILLDVLNTYFGARGRAQEEIATALQRLEAIETVYLYVLSPDGSVQAIHAMPETAQTQKDVTPWTRDAGTMLDQALVNAARPGSMQYANNRAEATYTALKTFASRLEKVPGRKAIVWVSQGVPEKARATSGIDDYEPVLHRFAAAFGQVEISIYSVAQSAQGAAPDSANLIDCVATLKDFADLTGGRMYASDHFGEALTQALADNRLSYRLGYSPPMGKAGAGYRKVRVSCKRPGVRLHTRQGYYT